MSTPIAATTTLAGTDGLHIAAETRGPDGRSGTPIVATTGWANTRSVWTSMVDDLCTDHTVTTWDLRGHGASAAAPPGDYTRAHALGDLTAVLDLAGRPAVLLGHSPAPYPHLTLPPAPIRTPSWCAW